MRQEYNRLANYSGSLFLLTYEQLSVNPESVAQEMLAYLGVKNDGDMVHRVIERSQFESLTGRPRGTQDETNRLRKGVVGDGSQELSVAQQRKAIDILERSTNKVSEKFGLNLSDYLTVV